MGATVSIITIFRDEERFLDEAVASVRAQTLQDWELLLVDDGSRDGSVAAAQRHAAGSRRIRYLRHAWHRNRGMSATRNLGIRRARGSYLAFLDADDVLEPDTLSESLALLSRHPDVAMTFGRSLYWYSWAGSDGPAGADRPDRPAKHFPHEIIPPPHLLSAFIEGGAAPCMCSVLVRRAAALAVGGFEARFRGLYEDQAFYAKLALHYPLLPTDACWSRYRQHEGSACSTARRRGGIPAARKTYLEWLERYARDVRPADPEVERVLASALAPFRPVGRSRKPRWKRFTRWTSE